MADKTSPSDSDIRAFWHKHGGQQHGPHVEHMTIAETKFYPLMRAFLGEFGRTIEPALTESDEEECR